MYFLALVKVRGHTNSIALAELLHTAANVAPGDRVLDVGHGCGDSLLLLSQRPLTCLHGVTSLPVHAQRAQRRLGDKARVWCADAVDWLAQDDGAESYDVILALDCAYHFRDRALFFQRAHKRLKPGGCLALVDLVSAWPYPEPSISFTPSTLPAPSHAPSLGQRVQHWMTCYLSGTPAKSMIPCAMYMEQLRAAGFSSMQLRDISHDVFPGFSTFLQGLGIDDQAWRGGNHTQWAALRAFGRVVHSWAQGGDAGIIRCVLVVAHA